MSAPTPVKVAFCITDLDSGGAERALVQLVTRLDRSRFEPVVICLSPRGVLVDALESAGMPVICLNARRRSDVGVLWRLYRELRRQRPVILQTFLFHANIAGRIAGWWARVPHIVSGIRVAERRRNLYLSIDRMTEWMVEKHVCVSEGVLNHSRVAGRLTASKLCVIPNGVDVAQFASATPIDLRPWGIEPQDETWVTVGRLDLQKGPWDLLQAVKDLRLNHPRLKLLWAGRGPLQTEMQQWIVDHDLQQAIQLIGWQDNIAGLLKASRGFVLSSHWEGMPNVVLEALAAGIPVLSTNVEGISENIIDGETGWVVKSGESLASRWDMVLNASNRDQIAAAGQHRVREYFSWELMADRYMRLYEDFLKIQSGA